MDQDIAALTREILDLPPEERIKLVDTLLGSLDAPDPNIDRAWANAAERRLDEYLAGKTSSRPADDVLAKYLK
jgi:putative addiction module component (TIGR02574 family)